MLKELGSKTAEKLKQRMAELYAADYLKDIDLLPGPRLHQLKGKRKGQFAVDLAHPFRLIFKPSNKPIPTRKEGGVDLELIDKIEIIVITDYH